MLIERIIKVIKSPQKAFEEEIETITFLLFLLLNGTILYLYSVVLAKFGLSSIQNVLPELTNELIKTLQATVTSYKFLYLTLCLPFVSTLFSASIYELLSQIIFGKTNGIKLMKNLAFASTPIMLSRFIYVIFSFLNIGYSQTLNIFFIIWEIILFILAISKTYEIEISKANLLFFAPYIIILLLIIPAII
ncbi:MAG: YIP1 family protein [Caldisericum sp.]